MESDEEPTELTPAELKARLQLLEQQVELLRAENELLFKEVQAYRQREIQLVMQRA